MDESLVSAFFFHQKNVFRHQLKFINENSFGFSVETAREEAASYRQQFKRPIPLKVLNDRLSNFIHAYTLYSAVRPFGVSAILVSYDQHNGPQMYMIEPSGRSYVSEILIAIINSIANNYEIVLTETGIFRLCNWQSQTIGQNRNRKAQPSGHGHRGFDHRSW